MARVVSGKACLVTLASAGNLWNTSGCQKCYLSIIDGPTGHSRIITFVHLQFFFNFGLPTYFVLHTVDQNAHCITLEFLFSYTQFYLFMQSPVFFFSCLVHSATYFNLVYRSGMQHGLPVVDCRHPRIKACLTSCQGYGSSATWWSSGKFYSHSMLSTMKVWMSLHQTFQILDQEDRLC